MKKHRLFLSCCLSLGLVGFAFAVSDAKADTKTSDAAPSPSPVAVFGEYYVGEPVIREHLQIVPNYLEGVEMDKMPVGMDMGKDAIHLEVDIHAQADEPHGFVEGAWIPYLTVHFTLTKEGSKFKKSGKLSPMTAVDGPHYANNVKMDGDGTYHLTYVIDPPSSNGFIRHIDKASGVPEWWKPITVSWTFTYPGKKKI